MLSNLLTSSSTAYCAQAWPAGGSTEHSQTAVQTVSLLQWPSHRSLHNWCLGSAHSISNPITSLSNSQSWVSLNWWNSRCYHGWFMGLVWCRGVIQGRGRRWQRRVTSEPQKTLNKYMWSWGLVFHCVRLWGHLALQCTTEMEGRMKTRSKRRWRAGWLTGKDSYLSICPLLHAFLL